MPVTDVHSDIDNLTLTLTADFKAPVDRVWKVYADPRQLERVWGPPTYPATFVKHEFEAGGQVHYFMTRPEGEKYPGLWFMKSVEEPTSFTFEDAFANEDFTPIAEMPTSKNVYSFAEHDGGTRATYIAVYENAESMQQVLDMGMIEGATEAISQIDDLLAAS